MRLLRFKTASQDALAVSWHAGSLAYVRARQTAGGGWNLLEAGVQHQGADPLPVFAARLQALGLRGLAASAMLRPAQYQLFQLEAPHVSPDELRAALRYQIRERVEHHIDDLVVDVLRVGEGEKSGPLQVYAVVATKATVAGVLALAGCMEWPMDVIDIHDAGQRNLQTFVARHEGVSGRANGALVLVEAQQALLTLCVNGELFQSRRLDMPQAWSALQTSQVDAGQRLILEVQRSIDLWDRTFTHLPLANLAVYAGNSSAELADMLVRETGLPASVMDLESQFPAIAQLPHDDRLLCIPLVGILMRNNAHHR